MADFYSMGMGQRQVQDLRQSQILTPRMIQSMEILQLPIMALQEHIKQELEENPFLEIKEAIDESISLDDDGQATPIVEEKSADPDGELVINEGGGDELDFNRLDALSRDWEDHFNEEHRPSRNGMDEEGDRKHDAMQNMPSRPQSLHDYLHDQLAYFDLPAKQTALVRYLISFIDDNGFLSVIDESDPEYQKLLKRMPQPSPEKRTQADSEKRPVTKIDESEYKPSRPLWRRCPSMAELAANYAMPVKPEEVEAALLVLQKLDPPGVGARDLRECLLLQLTPDVEYAELVRLLILNHLEDVQHNRLPVVQRRTGYDIPAIKEAIEVLKRFDPRPGGRFLADSTQYVVPDIVIELNNDGEYDIRLLDDWVPNIFISRKYVDLYKEMCKERGTEPEKPHDPKNPDPKAQAKKYLREKFQAAQWLMDSIEQRRGTLEKVTRAIIQHQREFLDKGPEYIEPLKMQQIADIVGVHVTTVSRAVDDKWVQTPRGVFSLKRFFGGGKQNTVTGEEVAYETIKNKLQEIIDHEDKSNPLSDEDLVIRLNEGGYPVKRRTVTKYRKMLHIPSSRQRKDWTACAVNGK